MIVSPKHASLILKRHLTLQIRPSKPPHKPGAIIPVQTRSRVEDGQEPLTHVRVVSVTEAPRDELTDLHARRAGLDELPALPPIVWLVDLELHHDHPRLLARRSEHRYTDRPHDAMRGEPEAVDAATADEFARRGRIRHQRRGSREFEERMLEKSSLEARITDLVAEARRLGVDVHPDIQFIRRRLDKVERRLRERKAA